GRLVRLGAVRSAIVAARRRGAGPPGGGHRLRTNRLRPGGGAVSGRTGLRDQLARLPELIRTSSPRLEEDARSLLSTAEHLGLQFVVLTGCGDSAIAARAASYAWHQLAGTPAFPLEAMDVARY